MDPSVVAPVATFASLVAIVWIVQSYASRNRRAFLEAVRTAFEKGVHPTPEVIKALGAPRRSKHSDIKWGVIWIAVALAGLVAGWALPDADDFKTFEVFASFSAFPGFVGAALLGYGLVMRREDE